MSAYFPEIAPRHTGRLPLDGAHVMHWQACGNPDGLPLLFLHGGPGSGASPKYRRMFDPDRFNIILFDQRGAGRSTPHLCLQDNTTAHLVADIERLRTHLGIARWIVFGPSWGSTLALAYAEAHPDRVSGLVVEGIFLGRDSDLEWLFGENGSRMAFPDAWADFIAPVPPAARTSVRATMDWCFADMQRELAEGRTRLDRLADPDTSLAQLRQSTLYRWTEYEDRLSYLDNPPEAVREGLRARGADFVAAHSLIEAHYFLNHCFLEPDQLLRDAYRLADIPMHILQSRYDMVCAAASAFALKDACPHAGFDLVPVNGHGMTETTQAILNRIMGDLASKIV